MLVDIHQVAVSELGPGQGHLAGGDVLFKVAASLGAGDRHDVVPLGQHPGEGELTGGDTLFFGQHLDLVDQLEIFPDVLFLKTW